MKIRHLCGLLTLVITNSCGYSGPTMQSKPAQGEALVIKQNKKYRVSCLFYGDRFKNDVGTQQNAIKLIILRDDTTGEEVKYEPSDPATIESSFGFYDDVWSPDEEYLVLPLGRFKGFCIMKASLALRGAKQHQCADIVRVYVANVPDGPTGLWHDFQKWEGSESFLFKAGLSGTDALFKYDISQGKLSSSEPRLPSVIGENAKGKLAIEPK